MTRVSTSEEVIALAAMWGARITGWLWLARCKTNGLPDVEAAAPSKGVWRGGTDFLLCRMDPTHAFTPDEYARWINQRIGEEVRERREKLGMSAYALGRWAGVSDQAILNIEQNVNQNGSLSGTLARISLRFGIKLAELIEAAERRP